MVEVRDMMLNWTVIDYKSRIFIKILTIGFTNILLYLKLDIMNVINLYNDYDSYAVKLVAKRYRTYLKEEQERKMKRWNSEWVNSIIAAIFWLLKSIISSLEKVNIKRRSVIEKVLVE